MRILNVTLDKFKCFRQVSFDLSKLTILTGANSSGKSSFLYSIISMLQSEQFPLYLSPNGEFVDLGSFEELAFNNDKTQPINISYKIDSKRSLFGISKGVYEIKTSWIENKTNKLPQLNSLIFSGPFIIIIIKEEKGNYFLTIVDKNPSIYIIKEVKKQLKAVTELKKARAMRIGKSITEIIEAPFSSVTAIFKKVFLNKNIHFLSHYNELFEELHEELLFNSNFIGSFREPPQRTYYQKSKSGSRINISGEGYVDQIVEWEETSPEKFKELNSILRRLQMLSEIKTKKLDGGRFELQVRVNKKGLLASLTDVGFGISQFLPIVVSDMQLQNGSLLMMSQPEIHLHPRIQASLADYIIQQAKSKQKRYILETHSEYLINRIRLNITKGILKPEDVSIYHFTNDSNGTDVKQILFTKKGEIKNAPSDFFDTYMMDVMDIALNS